MKRLLLIAGMLCLLLGQGFLPGNSFAGPKYPLVFERQITNYSCGPASLVMVARHWNVRLKQERLLRKFPPQKGNRGYTVVEMEDMARQSGLKAYSVHGDMDFIYEQLDEGRPLIVPLKIPYGRFSLENFGKLSDYAYGYDQLSDPGGTFNHFIIVYGIEGETVLVMDPVHGERRVRRHDFLQMWEQAENWALVIYRH